MSDENLQKPDEASPLSVAEGYEIVFNKGTNEITVKDPKGQTATIRATVIEPEDEDEEEQEPLTVDEFRDALQRIDALGLTWTADALPQVIPKSAESEGALLSDEFEEVQERYPNLPEELAIVVAYAITRRKSLVSEVGGESALKEKAAVLRELQITTADYRSEFFFKHSIKVPYFSNIDWEVVFKLEEKNVYDMPNAAYALLNLVFHDPTIPPRDSNRHRTMTVAANSFIVQRLIENLTEVKDALERSRELVHGLEQRFSQQEKSDVEKENTTVEGGDNASAS